MKILVCVDGSEHSGKALEMAAKIGEGCVRGRSFDTLLSDEDKPGGFKKISRLYYFQIFNFFIHK